MEPLYVRNPNEINDEDGEDSEIDIWDDSLLVKAFDKAISDAKDKVRKKTNVPQNARSKKSEKASWKIGDYCRAVYSDGVEYEAEILNISRNQCVVRYFGYGNEEIVNIKDLLVSHGEDARNQQARIGNSDEQSNDYDMEIAEPMGFGLPGIPPPPPPHIMKDCNVNESEALSAMLMSWYMSGYHTGYYQGLMKSKKKDHK